MQRQGSDVNTRIIVHSTQHFIISREVNHLYSLIIFILVLGLFTREAYLKCRYNKRGLADRDNENVPFFAN